MPDFSGLNATQSGMVSGMVSSSSISPGLVLTVILIGIVSIILAVVLTDQERFNKIMNVILAVVNSLKYAIIGVITVITGYMLYLVCNAIADSTKGIDPIWYLYAIGGYIALTAAGRFVVGIVEMITQMYARYVESKKSKEITVSEGTNDSEQNIL